MDAHGPLNAPILVIDDDAERAAALVDLITFFDVPQVRSAAGADWRDALAAETPGAVFVAAGTAAAAPATVRAASPDAALVVVGAGASAEDGCDVLEWPIRLDALGALIERFTSAAHGATQVIAGSAEFIGDSEASRAIRDIIESSGTSSKALLIFWNCMGYRCRKIRYDPIQHLLRHLC